jgi:WD40 repeat protein
MKNKIKICQAEYIANTQNSPDDTMILSSINSNTIGIHKLHSNNQVISEYRPFYNTIYDFDWFPQMTCTIPESCCFIASIKDHPAQLYDCSNDKVRHTYQTRDEFDQVYTPLTTKFNLNGSKLYCGGNSRLQIFDISGALEQTFATSPSKKSKLGLKGLVSFISFNPDLSGLYSACTFKGHVGLYDERSNQEYYILQDGSEQGCIQTSFTSDGRYLAVGYRNSDSIRIWDIRNTGEIIYKLHRSGSSNQRLYFTIKQDILYSGDLQGNILEYKVSSGTGKITKEYETSVASVSFSEIMSVGTGSRQYNCFNISCTGSGTSSGTNSSTNSSTFLKGGLYLQS